MTSHAMPLIRRLAPYLLLLLSALVTMQANPFRGETLAPMGLLLQQPGWDSVPIDLRVAHIQRSDILDGRLPSWLYAKSELRAGRLPLWNPLRVHGKPGIQSVSQSAFTPAFLAFVLIPDDALGYYAAGLVNLLLGGIGAFLLLRLITGGQVWPALFGALVFTYSGFHAAWFYWPHVNTSIWIPWLLFAVARYLETGLASRLPAIAAVSALMVLGGFPSVAAYGFGAACLLALIHPLHRGHWLRMPAVLLFIGIGFLLVLFALLPLAEQLAYAGTGHRRGGTILELTDFALFVDPELRGQPKVETTLYFGLPALGLALAGVAAYIFGGLRGNPYARFGLWLLGIALTLSFGLIHRGLIELLPTMSSNPWQRVSVLIPVAAAILSALALSRILPWLSRHRGLVPALAGCLLALQFIDQRQLFREFNRRVPEASFFASTPTIERMRAGIAPLQGVIGDTSLYLASGALTAYGLPEWFAHGFRSPAERNALRRLDPDPFVTATAASLRCSRIEFDARVMAWYGVRYIACNDRPRPLIRPQPAATACPDARLQPGSRLSLTLRLPKRRQIGTLLLDIERSAGGGVNEALRLELWRGERQLAAAELTAGALPQTGPASFDLGERLDLAPGPYRLELLWQAPEGAGTLVPAAFRPAAGRPRMEIDGQALPCLLALDDQAMARTPPPGFDAEAPEPGVLLLENLTLSGTGGAYYLPSLESPPAADYAGIKMVAQAADRYQLEYTAPAAGWVVLPKRAYPGWEARVDGQPVAYQRLFGLMPAIPVSGPSDLEFRYRPLSLYLAGALSLIAWLGLVLGHVWLRRRERRV